MILQNRRLITILIFVVVLLFIPLTAMQFTQEVNWTLSDFAVAGVLLLSTGLLCEWVLRKVTKITSRLVICAVIVVIFLLIWAELAVGVFGTPFSGR